MNFKVLTYLLTLLTFALLCYYGTWKMTSNGFVNGFATMSGKDGAMEVYGLKF